MAKYSKENIQKDKAGEPTLPIHIALKRTELEKAFRYVLKMILTKNRISQQEVLDINAILRFNPVIYESGRVDFENEQNIATIEKLIDEVWKLAGNRMFNEMMSSDFHRGFVKKKIE